MRNTLALRGLPLMDEKCPKISIITVCRNAGATIEETIKSVAGQSYPAIEYILIDGGSQDATSDIVRAHQAVIDTFVSENDNGIYDAMNKGISRSTGDYILFLNADDKLIHSRVIELAVQRFATVAPEIVFGELLHLDLQSGRIGGTKQGKLNKIHVFKNMPCQPSVFYRRDVFDSCGLFSTDFTIVSDFEWMLRAILKFGVSLQYIGMPIILFASGGASSAKYAQVHDCERSEVLSQYFNRKELMLFPFISRYCRTLTTIPVLADILDPFVGFKLKNTLLR